MNSRGVSALTCERDAEGPEWLPQGPVCPRRTPSSPAPRCGEAVQVSTREGPHPGLRAHGGNSQGVSGWGVTNAVPSTTVTFTQASMSHTSGSQPRLHEPGSGAWWA